MIDRELPPIAPDVTIRPMDIQEAFALCYLARYCDQAIQPRVLTSLQRAYGPTNVNLTTFVPNGRPGFCIASWAQDGVKKLIVAIEGIRSVASLRSLYYGYVGWATLPNSSKTVYGIAKTYADQIWTMLKADANFVVPYGQAGVPVTFTGHSMGAAVAEILGEYASDEKPNKARRVIKFGSPRVGCPAYLRQRNRTVQRASIYCDRDPIDILPQYAPAMAGSSTAVSGPCGFYATDGAAQRYTRQGLDIQAFREGGYGQAMQFARAYSQPMNTSNPWYDHALKAYRLMFCHLVDPWSSLDRWRFRYLEFNDENQWGLYFRQGQGITDQMETLNTTQPEPVPVDIAERYIRLAAEAAGQLSDGTETGQVWGGDGEDDQVAMRQIPQPAQPTLREIRSPVPPTFTPNAVGVRRRR